MSCMSSVRLQKSVKDNKAAPGDFLLTVVYRSAFWFSSKLQWELGLPYVWLLTCKAERSAPLEPSFWVQQIVRCSLVKVSRWVLTVVSPPGRFVCFWEEEESEGCLLWALWKQIMIIIRSQWSLFLCVGPDLWADLWPEWVSRIAFHWLVHCVLPALLCDIYTSFFVCCLDSGSQVCNVLSGLFAHTSIT